MSEKVLCPYCGCEMELHCHKIKNAEEYTATYICVNCDSYSPGFVGSNESALIKYVTERALRRCQPENRVLTREELFSMDNGLLVWHEEKLNVYSRWSDTRVEKDFFAPKDTPYGVKWRCWLRKPTEEERKAVKWDE